jgi:hypothetical protein
MIITALYTKMSEYAQKTIVINHPMSLSFHIRPPSSGPGKPPLQRNCNFFSGVARQKFGGRGSFT